MRAIGRVLILVNIFSLIGAAVTAQSSNPDPAMMELQKQIVEMRSQMIRMQKRIAELEVATSISTTKYDNDSMVNPSQAAVSSARRPAAVETERPDEPVGFQYRGLTVTPGGFLEGTFLVRTRNENADIANNYSAIPLNGSSNAQLSEFRGT